MTLKQKFQNEIETESTASLNMGDVLSWGVLIFGEGQDRKPKFWPRQKWLQAYDRMVIARLLPGSSTVEHSAVNRRVASSNLARGANLRFFSHLNATRRFGPLPKGRWFKSGLCNQLFFPVNEFPAPCNHPNF